MNNSYNLIKEIKDKSCNKRIVFISGNFNILHPGHLRLIRFAKECGDYLVVGVFDSHLSESAFINEELRLEAIQSINSVDFSFILNEPPESFISKLEPHIVVKGNEHEKKFNKEELVIKKYGGRLIFSSSDTIFSSVDLVRNEFKNLYSNNINNDENFINRHNIKKENLIKIIKNFKNLNICIIGDTIIDEYITCDALGMSQEDPTIVVTPILRQKFLGGAAIVALHAKSLGANVNFISIIGNDEAGKYSQLTLDEYNLNYYLQKDDSRPTTLKQRYRASNKTLLRVSYLRQHDINITLRQNIIEKFKKNIYKLDLLIFSDFNYGCLPQDLVNELINICDNHNIMIVADSQSSSQIGDISRFKNMSLITPTEREARLALQDYDSGLATIAMSLKNKTGAENVVITIGSEGALIQTDLLNNNKWATDKVSALNNSPKDVAGAGDSFLICSAMSLALGCDIWNASYLGSIASAIQVSRLGNIPIKVDDLISELK